MKFIKRLQYRCIIMAGMIGMLLTGCNAIQTEQSIETNQSTEMESVQEETNIYTFEKCEPDKLPMPRSNICNVYELETERESSLFLGQVKTLFGEPDYITENYEEMFSCAVAAKDQDGNVLYLEIYNGSSGAAIGGGNDEASEKAAIELARLIMNAEPTDYEWKGVYSDIPVNVKMGVKNGKPYYKEWR